MRCVNRQTAIDELRDYLVQLVDDEHSLCEVVARLGIFCKGFRRFSDEELRGKFDWIARRRPKITRAELEDLANRYKLARQEVLRTVLACDASMIDRDTCLGWDEFTDSDLARFYKESFGEEVQVTSSAAGCAA